MSDVLTAEATGETVGEAKWAAVRELERQVPGLDRSSVRFEVLSEGERGLLGVGYAPARVIAAVERPSDSPPVGDESPEATGLREFVERVVSGLGVSCSIRIEEGDEEIVAELAGADLGILIGRHGQTIDAIQYLANAAAHRRFGQDRRRLVVDAGGYRARRAATLHATAGRCAEQAAATGRRVSLEPMTAVERRIVHEYLKDDPEVETLSEGAEPNRFVVIVPRSTV